MNGESRRVTGIRAAAVVAAVTMLALAWPIGSPLYAQVYPGPDARTVKDAITDAGLDARFDSEPITQFETATFRATVIYATSSPNLPTVKVAWSNEATLAAQTEGTFDIKPTSASRQFLDAGTHRPSGGYALTWTWDVTPLVAGAQTLILKILPTVVVEGQVVPGLLNINKPIPVTVDVNPVQHDFDEVLAAAAAMKTDVPEEMIVGQKYDVGASMSLAGHAETVNADIGLAAGEHSSAVRIVEASPTPTAVRSSTASVQQSITRRWIVISDAPGQVDLVFTATVEGQAAAQHLKQTVPKMASARATEPPPPPPSFWDILQVPVKYVAPFVGLAVGVLALVAGWKKLKAGKVTSDGQQADESEADELADGSQDD
ncbi:hypothetical protein [Sinomonas sp. ASV322]|uniref:hypothetical protein n=1 Tax=Sinomonas sp. ASV322 TaxID=3041920 RepID=UPI0027DBC8E5|nr:hypothetical protein [Sinomonas sp. ASV322]MDQ4502355.1 hypothetical protein [Sinomonas sp. ASV322]